MTAAAPALILAAFLTGGCAISAEGELPEIEIVQRDIVIPGVPGEVRPADPMITVPVVVQPNEWLGLPPESFKSVKVREVIVSLKSGAGGDLSFLRSFRMGLNSIDAHVEGLPATEIAYYERSPNVAPKAIISAGKSRPVEVGHAWRDSATVLTVSAAGDLPEQDWTLDVTVRLSALLAY